MMHVIDNCARMYFHNKPIIFLFLALIIIRMVLILDANSEIGAHVRGMNRSRVVKNKIFFLRKDLFYFIRAQHVLSYHLI